MGAVSKFVLSDNPHHLNVTRYHGGWLAPNIYYLGAAGCVNVGGVRIAGVSGIYKSKHYRMGKPTPSLQVHVTLTAGQGITSAYRTIATP